MWVMPSLSVYETFSQGSQAVGSGRRRWAPPGDWATHSAADRRSGNPPPPPQGSARIVDWRSGKPPPPPTVA